MSKYQVIYHSMFGHPDEVVYECDSYAEASMEIAARWRRHPNLPLANYSISKELEVTKTRWLPVWKDGDEWVDNRCGLDKKDGWFHVGDDKPGEVGIYPAAGTRDGDVVDWLRLRDDETVEQGLKDLNDESPTGDCTGHPVAVQMGGAPKQEFVKYDGGKPALSGIPLEATQGVARVISYGRKKYSPGGFRKAAKTDGAQERYIAGALRHLMQMQNPDGTFTDESLAALDGESGLPHIDHAICGLLMLRSLLTKFETLPADPGVGKEPPK